jgi:transcriptional regulator with PAS, ATPase and Fis domain
VGESASICALRSQIERIAALEAPEGGVAPTVLIRGETGTGKDMIARSIHYHGPRSAGPFVDINCAAIPPALLEAELFGYERGAYTDAKAAKPGLFEAADGGTLFLDEIGHMELGMQVKLLKALEDRSVRRIGGLRAKTFNVRIVAATNRDLGAAIAEGAFRPDLYYRINTLTLHIPPLRERGDDITLLARHFLESFSQQYGLPAKELAPEAEVAMRSYSWPGNVRELAHVMERAVLLHGGPVVTLEQLGFAETKCQTPVVVEIDGTVRVDFSAGKIVLDEVERQLIYEALRVAGWNRTRAAELLGISKETLRYRMEKYELHPPVKTGES